MAKFSDQRRLLVQPDGQIIESPRGRLFIDAYTAKMTDLSGGARFALRRGYRPPVVQRADSP